jgi:L-fuconolactonase
MDDRSIIDTHVHLWDVDRLSYAWLEEFPQLNRTHGLDEYDAAAGPAPIEQIVFVECTESFDDDVSRREVEWAAGLVEQDSRIQGIVAHASLEKGREARPHLDWLADRPLVTGVRRILQEEERTFFHRDDFVEGLRLLADYNFSFDLTVKAPQLPAALDLVDRCPDVTFVLDHLGKPRIREKKFNTWDEHVGALAERPNVVCKFSGLLTEADLENWTVDAVRPYIERAYEHFGPDRILFGGDWPVLRLAADLRTWLDLLDTVFGALSSAEREALYRTNAERIYGLA